MQRLLLKELKKHYFCVDQVSIGDPVFEYHESDEYLTCSSVNKRSGAFIGISMQNVLDPDLMIGQFSLNTVSCGSRINIMTKGYLVYHLDKQWMIPAGQKIYYCPKKKEITWRKTCIKIGKAISDQDSDGFIKVEINL